MTQKEIEMLTALNGKFMVEVMAKLDSIESSVRLYQERRVSAAEAARQLGFDKGFFHGRPWRIPGFCLNGHMHSLAAWREWLDQPEAERRAKWDSMPLEERRLARGIA
jgi:hypothetical protein